LLRELRVGLRELALLEHNKQEDLDQLYEYVSQASTDKMLPSKRLLNMIAATYTWVMRTKPMTELVHDAIEYLRLLQDFQEIQLADIREDRPHLLTHKSPTLFQTIIRGDRAEWSLSDKILTKQEPVWKFQKLLQDDYGQEEAKQQKKQAKRETKHKKARQKGIRENGKVLSKAARQLKGEARVLQEEQKKLARRGAALPLENLATRSSTSQKRKVEDEDSASEDTGAASGKLAKNRGVPSACPHCNQIGSPKCAFKCCKNCCPSPSEASAETAS